MRTNTPVTGNSAIQQNLIIVKRKGKQKLVVGSEPLTKFLREVALLQPKFWVDQIFKDVFTNRVPVPEDLPLEEQQQRIKAQLMLQDLILGIFGSMELKGGVK